MSDLLLPLDYGEQRPGMLDELAEIFSAKKRDWSWGVTHHLYGVEYAWVIDQVLAALDGDPRGQRVLDAGGGGGAPQYYLARRGARVVNLSRGHGPLVGTTRAGSVLPVVQYITADFGDAAAVVTAGLQPGSFDAVIAVSAVEHNPWDHILRTMRVLLGLVRLGGHVIVTVPAGRQRAWYPTGAFPSFPNYPAVYLFDVDAVAEVARSVTDLGVLAVPADLAAGDAYRAAWDRTKAEMDAGRGNHRVPYLSAGFVFERRRA